MKNIAVIHFNDHVTVTLTEIGAKHLNQINAEANVRYQGFTQLKDDYKPMDKFTTELWDLMYTFGKLMYHGCEPPFLHAIEVARYEF